MCADGTHGVSLVIAIGIIISSSLAEFLDMDSHCPEAVVLLIVMFLGGTILTKYPHLIGPMPPDTQLHFYLDNKSVMSDIKWQYNAETSIFDYLKADYDIVQGIQKLQSHLPLKESVS